MLEIYARHGDGDDGGGGDGDDDGGKAQAREPGKNGQNGDVGGGGWEVEAKEQEKGMVSHRCHGGSAVV